ncbi:coenzyme F420-0:L-glutamate ligase [Streptomyces sp. NPDC057963]|uniref:coenzyme F420-0:L-glutamate ligase n=1 Tax=Streptomyces sp. NPDC057963 TaxID=3346290 RepID=UPI0036F17BBD
MENPNQSLAAQQKTAPATSNLCVFALEPFPELQPGDDLAGTITGVLTRTGIELQDGDVVVVASKVVSIAEKRYVDLASVTPGAEALELSAKTGKPADIVQLILDSSEHYFLAIEKGPIIGTRSATSSPQPGSTAPAPRAPGCCQRTRTPLPARCGTP